MGGEIGCESSPGKGSRLWFNVSLARGATLQPEISPTGGALPLAPTGARLLLVEDIEVNREIAVAVLQSRGYEVHSACDGVEALDILQKSAFDLVLMDIQMPRMDGLAATKAVRSSPGPMRGVPILAMTANVLPAETADIMAAGMDGCVSKPFRPAELVNAIENCLARHRSGQTVTGADAPAAAAVA
jgi:CheY-like chemotaxis protein